MKYFLTFLMIICSLFGFNKEIKQPIVLPQLDSLMIFEIPEVIKTNNKTELLKQAKKLKKQIKTLRLIEEELNTKRFSRFITILNRQYNYYINKYNKIVQKEEQERLRKLKEQEWNLKVSQYPTAATIWQYLRNCGYSNAVCAGILGNIMAEVGGQTLYIQPYLYGGNSGYYGICQWSLQYFPGVQGASLMGQLNFLQSTIYSSFGSRYYSFVNSATPEAAALSFAKNYERCASYTYYQRQVNARRAYNYFI